MSNASVELKDLRVMAPDERSAATIPPQGDRLRAVYDVPVQVSAVLGRASIPVNQLLRLGRGAVVELDRRVGEPVDIFVDNRLVARGEVIVVGDRLGVTMTEIVRGRGRLSGLAESNSDAPSRGRPSLPHLTTAMRIATKRGALVRQRRSAAEALDELREGQGADLLFLDVMLDVPEIVAMLRAERVHLPIVAYGINADPARAVAAIKAGAREFLTLPPDPQAIALVLATLADARRDLVSVDPAMAEVLGLARRFAPSDASVLITGESGTGKEVVARAIHARSRRARRPFVAVNCAALPENLLESELFGHEKGAFTGADRAPRGMFEAADGGTLFLDEIGEMRRGCRRSCCACSRSASSTASAAAAPIKVDVRVIAATQPRPRGGRSTPAGSARTCYYRLNVVTSELPPLRERPQDIAAAGRHFLDRVRGANGLPRRGLDAGGRERCCAARLAGQRPRARELYPARGAAHPQGRIDRQAISWAPRASRPVRPRRARPGWSAARSGRSSAT